MSDSQKKFMSDKDNKYRVKKLIKLTEKLNEVPDIEEELDDMKITKIKKYKNYDLVKVTINELKLILPNYNLKEGTYLNYLGIEKIEKDLYSIQLDIYIEKFIKINLNEISFEENCNLIYHLYDTDGNNEISIDEFNRLMKHYSDFNNLEFNEEQVKIISQEIFKKIDIENQGFISKNDLIKYLSQYNGNRDIELTLNPFLKLKTNQAVTKVKAKKSLFDQEMSDRLLRKMMRKKHRFWLQKYWNLNKGTIITIFIYFIFLIGISYIYQLFESKTRWKSTVWARAFASGIFINIGLMLIFMSLTFMTWLNKMGASKYLPLKDTKLNHQFCGYVLIVCTIFHVILHLAIEFPEMVKITSTKPHDAYVTNTWLTFSNQTGLFGFLSLVIFAPVMIFPLISWIKKNCYEVFYLTHKLYYLGLIFMGIHAKTTNTKRFGFIIYMSIPLLIFLIEQIIRLVRFFTLKTTVNNLKYLESGVILLELKKPKNFEFLCGQWAYIQIPKISSLQWHPFTMASNPEDKDIVYFYISPVGGWTKNLKSLHDTFIKETEMIEIGSKNELKLEFVNEQLVARLDGPFGAPAEHFKSYEHLMFIASGVGATPFSSILISLLHMMRKNETIPFKSLSFYWLQRQYSKVDYLNDILGEVLKYDTQKIMDLNVFITGAQPKTDLRYSFHLDRFYLLMVLN